jgi:flagellin
MSLGVLNNISAIYAQNNLSNTQAALSKTLQQLSSGSRINSGADDAAGLSLANGLQASSTALSQSATNASEGVGFLQVADGALSQVTGLLNRAVTLATEASNGTLNGAQKQATENEYSSIMTEISTISHNTEYNGINVFANGANVYTSDGTVNQAYATKALGSTSSDSLNLGGLILSNVAAGNVKAATTAQVGTADSYGNTIAAADVMANGVLDQNGNSITIDLTAMGSTVTAGTAIADANAVEIIGGKAVDGAVAAAAATGTDSFGANIAVGDYVFTPGAGGKTIDLGATDPHTQTDAVFGGTSLSTAAEAKVALVAITNAVTSVASTRGVDGAEINTLSAVGNVMTTQSTNTLSAENDVMATDYGQATSNLSKYQILSQTGIAALAQANQSQQLITKLLQ